MFTWFITLLGALLVYFFKDVKNSVLDLMLGLSGGVMISASFFSLLLPALESGKWLFPSLGFLLGGIILFTSDKICNKVLKKEHKNNFLLILSITLHNIPEGMAIGVAFGSLKYGINTSLISAVMLAFGIGIQNFPEGAAISLPLRRSGMNVY